MREAPAQHHRGLGQHERRRHLPGDVHALPAGSAGALQARAPQHAAHLRLRVPAARPPTRAGRSRRGPSRSASSSTAATWRPTCARAGRSSPSRSSPSSTAWPARSPRRTGRASSTATSSPRTSCSRAWATCSCPSSPTSASRAASRRQPARGADAVARGATQEFSHRPALLAALGGARAARERRGGPCTDVYQLASSRPSCSRARRSSRSRRSTRPTPSGCTGDAYVTSRLAHASRARRRWRACSWTPCAPTDARARSRPSSCTRRSSRAFGTPRASLPSHVEHRAACPQPATSGQPEPVSVQASFVTEPRLNRPARAVARGRRAGGCASWPPTRSWTSRCPTRGGLDLRLRVTLLPGRGPAVPREHQGSELLHRPPGGQPQPCPRGRGRRRRPTSSPRAKERLGGLVWSFGTVRATSRVFPVAQGELVVPFPHGQHALALELAPDREIIVICRRRLIRSEERGPVSQRNVPSAPPAKPARPRPRRRRVPTARRPGRRRRGQRRVRRPSRPATSAFNTAELAEAAVAAQAPRPASAVPAAARGSQPVTVPNAVLRARARETRARLPIAQTLQPPLVAPVPPMAQSPQPLHPPAACRCRPRRLRRPRAHPAAAAGAARRQTTLRAELPRDVRAAAVARRAVARVRVHPRRARRSPIEVGSGRFAKAYLGEERWLESKTDFRRFVVIKILQKGVSDEDRMRFQIEKELLERVQGHPNIIRLYASGESDDPEFVPQVIRDKVENDFVILERLDMSLEERLKGARVRNKREDLLVVRHARAPLPRARLHDAGGERDRVRAPRQERLPPRHQARQRARGPARHEPARLDARGAPRRLQRRQAARRRGEPRA